MEQPKPSYLYCGLKCGLRLFHSYACHRDGVYVVLMSSLATVRSLELPHGLC